MVTNLLIVITLALLWLGITNQITIESFAIGSLIGLGLVALGLFRRVEVSWRRLPDQLIAICIYVVTLYRDIILSGLDLTRRLLARDMGLRMGIIAIPILDPDNNQIVAALSAAEITLAPGQLVVEFEDSTAMYVHCLDVEAAIQKAEQGQARQVRILRRILGRSA